MTTPSPGPRDQAAETKLRIAVARRMLFRNGLDSQIGGHVSVRVPGEDAFWVTPFQYFDESLPEHVSMVGSDLVVREPGTLPASPGINFHADIYAVRPDVNSIIHTHSNNIAVLTTTGRPFEICSADGAIFLDAIGYFVDNGEVTPEMEGPLLAKALGRNRAVLMSHHGAIHVGASLEIATIEAIMLERCAGEQIAALTIDAPPLPRALAERRRATLLGRDVHGSAWQAYLRRLRETDPALFVAP